MAYSTHEQGYGFTVGAHDPARPVFIDPLVRSSYLGGSANDRGLAVGRCPTNSHVCVTGTTWSVDFPGTTGGAQEEHAGAGANQDVFVARFSHDLTVLEQVTYFGGSGPQIGLAGNEEASCITASLHEGYIYVAGFTKSSGLPGTAGAAQSTPAGGVDAFVVAFNEDLDEIVRSTFVGGNSDDVATGINFFNAEEDVYVTGYTRSTSFWGVDAFSARPDHGGGTWDGFVTRLGLTLAGGNSTFLGGSGDDRVHAICHDSTGMIHVAGETRSTDFPGAADGWWHTNRGYIDAFVSRIDPDLRTPPRTTYFGGEGEDRALGIGYEPIDEVVIICGVTTSDEDDLRYQRTRVLGAQHEHGGGERDGFVAVFDRQLQTEPRVSYIGGRGDDIATGVDTTSSNRIFVVGETTSPDLPATEGGAQGEYADATDAFVARFTSRVNALMQVTYLGGSGADMGYGLVFQINNLYVTGITGSPDFPGTAGSAQPAHGGGTQDAFVARFDRRLTAPTVPDPSFALVKAKVKQKSSGYKVEIKKAYLVPGTGGYVGNGEDIRIFIDGIEVAPPGARTTKVKRSKIKIKSTTDPKCKLTIKTSSWKVKLKVKRLPTASIDPTDGITFRIHLLGLEGEVTGQTDSGGKKLLPATGTVE